MSSTSPPAFEHLPAEIHGNILRQMSSPEDVYSTIRASPKALGSFLCFREDILIQALQAHLPPKLFTGYLGFLHIPRYEDFNHVPNRSELSAAARRELSAALRDDWQNGQDWEWEACKYQAWAKVVHRFFRDYFAHVDDTRALNSPTYDKPKTSEKAKVNRLMSIYGMIKRFIRQYQVFVRNNLVITYHDGGFDPQFREAQLSQELEWSPLTERETFRLHRGFLRYELCCRLNTIPDRSGATLQFREFGSHFFRQLSEFIPYWQQEEMWCIRSFVAKQYHGVARDVVEDFCCDVWRLSRNARLVPDNEVILAPNLTAGAPIKGCGFYSWEFDMSCLGLPLLQQVLQSGVNDQRRFLKNTNLSRLPPYWGFPFMEDRSFWDIEWDHKANHIYKSIACFFLTLEDGVRFRRPAGWLDDLDSHDDIQHGLRETGWVFWEDHSRLEYFAIPGRDSKGHHIRHYIPTLKDRYVLAEGGLGRKGMMARYPREMYVTKKDHQELMDNFAGKPVEPDAEHFLLHRLRAISDWASKKVSPAFQEICSVTHATE